MARNIKINGNDANKGLTKPKRSDFIVNSRLQYERGSSLCWGSQDPQEQADNAALQARYDYR